MKLLIAADIFFPELGGPATYAPTLANALTKQGSTVAIVSLNPHSDRSIVSCPVYPVSSKLKLLRYVHYAWLLFKHARTADVVYAMGPVNAGFPALLVARMLRKKFVVKVVGDYAWEQGIQRFGVTELPDEFQQKTYGGQVEFLRSIESYVTRRADVVITPCEYLKNMVVGWGVPADHIRVINNAVDVHQVAPAKKPTGERWIVSSGRMTKWKGMETLVTLLPRLLAEFPDVRLKLIGVGPEFKNVEKKVKELRLESFVELLGTVPRDTALACVHAADAFILNSGYEGLSHALIEALHFGRPVFASSAGGDSEVVIPGKSGVLFPYDDADEIVRVLQVFLRTGEAQNAGLQTPWREEFFNRFTVSTMVANTKALLESL